MIQGTVLHVCLNVADSATSIDFYEQLGFEQTWQFTTQDGETTNYYVADGEGVELQLSETEGEQTFEQGTAWDHLAVAVDDVEETVASIDHYGIAEEPGIHPTVGACTAFVEDPDGHLIEFVEPLEED